MIRITGEWGEDLEITDWNRDHVWHFNPVTTEEPHEYEIRLNLSLADSHDEIREQGKAMISFAFIISLLEILIPGGIELESEEDDHELMYWHHFDEEEMQELIDGYHYTKV